MQGTSFKDVLTGIYPRLMGEKIITPLFFILLLGLGIAFYDDYPMAIDEKLCRDRGMLGWEYVTEGKQGLFSYAARYHSTIFEIPAYGLEAILGLTGRNALLFRHFLVFLSFYFGVALFYILCKHHFRSWIAGLVCCLLLVISPRITGSAFYNSKDIPFMSASIAGLLTLFWLLERLSPARILVHSLVTAAMIDLRLMALLMPAITVLTIALTVNSPRLKSRLIFCILYLAATSVFVIVMWPLLWPDPAGNFIEAFKIMSHYPPKEFQLYRGVSYNTDDLPWHYIPTWITITTPMTYTLGFLIFALPAVLGLLTNPRAALNQMEKTQEAILLTWTTAPIIALIVLESTTHSTWRHFFYIYPAFVLLSAKGWDRIIKTGRALTGAYTILIVAGVLSANLWTTSSFMVRNHPYEQFYFNMLAGGNMSAIEKEYTMTYWGVVNKDGMDYILSHDNRNVIPVYFNYNNNVKLTAELIGKDADRINAVLKEKDSDYSVLQTMDHFRQYCRPKGFVEAHSLKIDDASVMKVYRRCGPEETDCPQERHCEKDTLP